MKALLLSLLLISTLTSQTKVHDALELLENSKLGRSILQTVFMQVQSDEPISNLVDMLTDLENDIETQQGKADRIHERKSSNCDNDLGQLDQIIAQATIMQLSLKSELDQLNPQKTQAVANLQRKMNEIKSLKNELERQTDRRQKQNQNYLDIVDEYEKTLYKITQIRTLFDDYLDSLQKDKRRFKKDESSEDEESFLQKPKSLQSAFYQINKLKHDIQQEAIKGLITQIAKMIQTDQEEASKAEIMTNKAISILKQLELFIQSQRQFEDLAEQQRADLFNGFQQTYTDQIISSTAIQNELQGFVQSMSNQITALANEKYEIEIKLTQKQQEREDRLNECQTENSEHEIETQKRANEIQILELALELIATKLGALKKAILEKGGY